MKKRVLFPLPDRDFDVTESAVPWKVLTRAGVVVEFATEEGGNIPQCDPLLLTGVVFGKLGANEDAIECYREMEKDPLFQKPHSWKTLDFSIYDGLILVGGHAQGMKQYLGSTELQEKVALFWTLKRPVGAICHGTLVAARAGVLKDVKTACLPTYMERLAYLATFWKLGRCCFAWLFFFVVCFVCLKTQILSYV
jgi:putative intracellular protease/amidase